MKSHPRSASTGQTLMSQGEPMVWLTGGMFAIACTMILSLLGFILYQGLLTHWQRPFAMYALNDGGFVAGELQSGTTIYDQPSIDRRARSTQQIHCRKTSIGSRTDSVVATLSAHWKLRRCESSLCLRARDNARFCNPIFSERNMVDRTKRMGSPLWLPVAIDNLLLA